MTYDQRQVIRHSLGLDWAKLPYRNHFAADAEHYDYPAVLACVNEGLMYLGHTDQNGMMFFHVTESGARAVGTSLPKGKP